MLETSSGNREIFVPKTPEHFSCTLYETLRNKFFHDKIIKKYNFFNDFDVNQKFCSYLTILIHLFVNQFLLLFLRLWIVGAIM